MNTENHSQTAAFLWSIADLLRGDFKQSQYGRIILPFTLLRRMECVLAPTKEEVVKQTFAQEGRPETVREMFLLRAADPRHPVRYPDRCRPDELRASLQQGCP